MPTPPTPNEAENEIYKRLSDNTELLRVYRNNSLVYHYFNKASIGGESYESTLEKLVIALVDQNGKYLDMAVNAEAKKMPDPLFTKGKS